MSKARHKKASGGRAMPFSAPDMASEATEKMPIGKVVGKAPGGKSKPRMDKRQRGGRVA